ncbi:DsbA family protein [uncultured Sulfitobacter sp.]|uniref:DsbA family protein n=1 Tax=uncultured Sulfitobacter sp. TaxID=191468 RepID=UPI002613FBF5|nr:DsbA family protein [uncultured Sulfitobacter sp.]
MNRRNILLGGFAFVGLGGWALTSGLVGGGGGGSTPVNPLVGAANAQSSDIDTSVVPDMVLGSDDAPVTVIEYASYTCPHCARFHESDFKQLKANYIDTGKVKFIYREVYFDRYGLWASMIARCAGEEKFFGISDMLYKGQSEWTRAGEPSAIADELRKIGLLAGLDKETLDACLSDATQAETLYAWYQQNAEADGITSTPSFLINGEKYGNEGYAAMAAVIDTALGS